MPDTTTEDNRVDSAGTLGATNNFVEVSDPWTEVSTGTLTLTDDLATAATGTMTIKAYQDPNEEEFAFNLLVKSAPDITSVTQDEAT